MKKFFLYIFIIINLLLIISLSSCFNAKDDEFALTKEDYTGNQLKIEGYYYQEQDGFYYTLYFFYRDGTILYGGGHYSESELKQQEEEFSNGSYYEYVKNDKYYWGLFKIEDNKIQFERWYSPFEDGSYPAGVQTGEIINDTTFHLSRFRRSDGSERREEDETYHFRRLSPKPDSTNNFVK